MDSSTTADSIWCTYNTLVNFIFMTIRANGKNYIAIRNVGAQPFNINKRRARRCPFSVHIYKAKNMKMFRKKIKSRSISTQALTTATLLPKCRIVAVEKIFTSWPFEDNNWSPYILNINLIKLKVRIYESNNCSTIDL